MRLSLLFATGAATGEASPPLTEHEILVLLVQLVILIGVARILGGLFKRMGQPPVVGELLAGVLLGPTFFGRIAPDAFDWVFGDETVESVVFALAWLGVIFLLIVIGYETDLAIIARFRKAAGWVSAGGFLIPLAVMGTVALAAPDIFVGEGTTRSVFAGFFALALSVSALPVVAKILHELGLLRRNFGQITLAAGMAMDAVGWLMLAALSGIALDGFRIDLLGRSFGGLILFLALAVTVGRWFLDRVMRVVLDRGSSVTAALTVSVLAAFIGGIVTQALQLEAILGAFLVGILLASTRHQLPEVRRTLETVTAAVFAPIFFAFSGLRVDIGLLRSGSAIVWTVGLVVLAIAAKLAGTAIGARFGGIRGREAWALGAGLSALGAMGVVVAIVALNLGVVSEAGYTVLVLVAIATSLVAPQLLRWVVRGWEVPPEEAARLDREALRATSEILGSRRILLPTRGGANSRYAARILTSVFDEPDVTVLAVDVPARRTLFGRGSDEAHADPTNVDLDLDSIRHKVVQTTSRDPAAAIARESRLGYDVMLVGASVDDRESAGLFSTMVDRMLALVDIPTVVVRLPRGFAVEDRPRNVLVAVVANRSSRAAEELAYSIVRETGGRVHAVHIVNRPADQAMMFDNASEQAALRAGHDVVAAATAFGERLGVDVEGSVYVAVSPETEIVDLANSGEFDLLVIGASNRPITDRPFFGHRVHSILEHAEIPVAVVTLPTRPQSSA
ncbi:MAG: cation:proton antiporter [Actinomycetota bacterium]|nr:cation:proton antiporter [Actinomycetota bacterium]